MRVLDPWDDAALLAQRLQRNGAALVIVLGAEAWCDKCKTLKPFFDEQASMAPESMVLLWLDLEEHAEFLGEYIPESLPELIVYQRGRLTHKTLLNGEPESFVQALRSPPGPAATPGSADDPGIYRRLIQPDWAQ